MGFSETRNFSLVSSLRFPPVAFGCAAIISPTRFSSMNAML
jgi:hypothetical protein